MLERTISLFLNSMLLFLCKREHIIFRNSLADVRKSQERVLKEILKENADSEYGKKYCFCRFSSVHEFQKNVPLTSYEDYMPYIEKIVCGEENVLSKSPIITLELSSGSTSASKFIPYTQLLKQQFLRGIKPWIYDLYKNSDGLTLGKSYWSITPVVQEKRRTAKGIPIGFEEDSQYFGKMQQFFLNRLFAVPGDVKNIHDLSAFQYTTLLFLVKEGSLSLISVWSPTFLLLLIDVLPSWISMIIDDIENGTINSPGEIEKNIKRNLERRLGKNRRRAGALRKIISNQDGFSFPYESIWTNLKIISCWTDSTSGQYISKLQEYFPDVKIQGKGLLSTESFVSLPMVGGDGGTLSVNSHFFEFIECTQGGCMVNSRIKLAHELEAGKTYSVVVTTGGGFYRYRMFDLVKVVEFNQKAPVLCFLGKEKNISDLFGEKLNELHIKAAVEDLCEVYKIEPFFYMVAPELYVNSGFYTLYIQSQCSISILEKLKKDMEEKLKENFHYRYCRDIGQLHGFKVFSIDKSEKCTDIYINHCIKMGLRAGNVKPAILNCKPGWKDCFKGFFI